MLKSSVASDRQPGPGGWQVLRERTDKPPNALEVAKNILRTIRGMDLEEPLKQILAEVRQGDFVSHENGKKRSRAES